MSMIGGALLICVSFEQATAENSAWSWLRDGGFPGVEIFSSKT